VARKVRIQYPGAIYQVINRGDRREAIFEDDEDRERLLQTLTQACQKTGWQVHAYCLMRNHLVEGLKRMGWSEADLSARRKGERGKVQLARKLRSKTTMPLAWIAMCLHMGSRGHLAWLLQQRGSGRLQAPTDQGLLEI